MKYRNLLIILCCVMFAILFWGCSSSEESEQNQEAAPPPPKIEKKTEQQPAQAPPEQKDLPKAEVTNPPEKQSDIVPTATPISHELPKSNFSVQIGAFSMPDKADQWASLAKTRFGKSVYTLKDEKTSNTKVLVGEFDLKDEARKFRDQIVQQFPDDYKDAWVFEVPHN